MRNVLVTGGAGFIGSNFVHFLLDIDHEVRIVNLDALTYAGSRENLRDISDPTRHLFVQGNILDRELVDRLLQEYQIDTLVHFAAETHVDRSILGPMQFIQTNVVGTFTLLEAVRQFWLVEKALGNQRIHFHHVSTDEVFGSLAPDEPAWTEEISYKPNSPYAASKASSDHLVRSYYHTYGLPVTITNCSNNYGPRQFPEKLIPLMILNAIQGKSLPIYGDGQQIRDWLYVQDHCEAIWRVIQRGKVGETYNIGGNNQPPNIEIVRTICRTLDEYLSDSPNNPHESLIEFVADRPGHDRRYAMDISKIGSELGWEPREWLQSGLRKTIGWYLNHEDWVTAVQKQSDYEQWLDQNYQKRGEK